MGGETISIVDGADHLDEIRALILEYVAFLGRDLAFQAIQAELDGLRDKYTPPNGRILAAVSNEHGESDESAPRCRVVGCVAYYRHSPARCEMKRLYVKPEFRALHLGRRLVGALIEGARADGYAEMVLDTIRPLKSAIRLYEQHGFVETAPYYENPMDDVIYMRLPLR